MWFAKFMNIIHFVNGLAAPVLTGHGGSFRQWSGVTCSHSIGPSYEKLLEKK